MSFSIFASSSSFGSGISDAMDESKVGLAAKFVRIKAGSFTMGSPYMEAGRAADEVQHRVTLTRDFEMQATEVTQLQYFFVTGTNPSFFFSEEYSCPRTHRVIDGIELCPQHPVELVSWVSTQEFIDELNAASNNYLYRLPTEAEWEYAARAGTNTMYFYGDDPAQLTQYGWYDPNSNGRTHEVASLRPNPNGLYDMYGSVWEWLQDKYGNYPAGYTIDPTGPTTGEYRVIRGGSWGIRDPLLLRSAQREQFQYDRGAGNRTTRIGFRLVRVPR